MCGIEGDDDMGTPDGSEIELCANDGRRTGGGESGNSGRGEAQLALGVKGWARIVEELGEFV